MAKILYSLYSKEGLSNNLGTLIARDNQLTINTRLLSLVGDLVVYHNRVLKVIDLLPKGQQEAKVEVQMDRQQQDMCKLRPLREVVPEWKTWVTKNSSI